MKNIFVWILMLLMSMDAYSQVGRYLANGGGSCSGTCSGCSKFVSDTACSGHSGFNSYKDPIWSNSGTNDESCSVSPVCHTCDKGGYYVGGGYCAVSCGEGSIIDEEGVCIESNNNNGDSPNNTCNPINVATGNKNFIEVDASLKSLSLTRSYNSLSGKTYFLYQQHLKLGDQIIAVRADGNVIRFSPTGNSFLSTTQDFYRLEFSNETYTLHLKDGSRELYDSQGKLISIRPSVGNATNITYGSNQFLVQSGNESIQFYERYDAISEARLSDGRTIKYQYYPYQFRSGTLITIYVLEKVVLDTGEEKQYLRENSIFPLHITGIIDEKGKRISSVTYDSVGRAISSEKGVLGSGIERTQVEYHSDGSRTVTNALGKKATYHFSQINGEFKMTQVVGQESDNCLAADKFYSYNDKGYLERKTDWGGNTTVFIRDNFGREISRTEAFGTPQARTIQTEWHADFSKPVKIIELERYTEYSYDSWGGLVNKIVTPLP